MLDELFDTLESIPGIGRIYSFLPDYRGRGYLMEKARITVQDYEKLSDKIKKTFNISRYKTQKDWLSSGFCLNIRKERSPSPCVKITSINLKT